MKTLKESILNRSNHGAEGFKTQRRNEIEKWLKEYDIKNYTINDDLTIDVDGDVNLARKNLMEFPDYIQFGVVKGTFNCSSSRLTSLRGCPREVRRAFFCYDNQLTSLEGAPENVWYKFDCSSNKLTTLEGAPEKVGAGFWCIHNNLTSLVGAPKEVGESFYCTHNKLTSLIGTPKEVRGDFYCSHNKVRFTENDVRRVCEVKGEIIV